MRLKSSESSRSRNSRRHKLRIELLESRRLLAVATWDGGGADDNWTTANNWAADVAPSANDDLVFPSGAARAANVNNFTAGTQFGSVQISGSNYAITGNSVKLVGGVTSQGTGNSFAPNVQLTGAGSIGQAGSSTFIVGGTIDLNGNNLSVNTPSGTTQFNGAISGTGNLSFGGLGQAVLATNNSYTGSTSVTSGTLVVQTGGGLGTADGTATTGTLLTNDASLRLVNSITVA
ncbi:MAG: hypothetical protein WBD31_11780, partial [Rubripirellula sp.]